MSDVLFFNAVVSNDTALISSALHEEDMNVEAGFSNTFNAGILDKQNDYDLSIVRLVIPSDTIDLLNITTKNAADYQIGFTYESKVNSTDTKLTRVKTMTSLPKSVGSFSSTEYPNSYKSTSDVIEGINRALATSYYNMVYDISQTTKNESNYGYHRLIKNTTFDTAVSNTITFPTYTPSTFETRVCSVVLTLYINITSQSEPFSVILGNSNTECLVTSSSPNQPEYSQLTNTCMFAEFGVCSLYKGTNMGVLNGSYNIFYPAESFLSFSTTSSGGSWYLSVVNATNSTIANQITGTISATLEVIELANIPSSSPVFGINSSNKLEILYQQHFVTNNMKIAMTPKLYRMLAFTGLTERFVPDFKLYEFIYPNLPMNHPIYNSITPNSGQKTLNGYNTLSFSQFNSTIYRLNNVSNILITAQALGITAEFQNDNIQAQVIQDFVVNTENDMGDLIFSTDASVVPYRRYRLQSDLPLHQMSFTVYIKYKDGSLVKATLAPGCQFSMKIGFFKRNVNNL